MAQAVFAHEIENQSQVWLCHLSKWLKTGTKQVLTVSKYELETSWCDLEASLTRWNSVPKVVKQGNCKVQTSVCCLEAEIKRNAKI